MSLDLGELFALADINDLPFQQKYPRLVKQFADLSVQAEKSAAGIGTVDEAFAGLSATASTAAASVTRASRATQTSAAAEEKAAAAARSHAAAVARVSGVMADLVGVTQREQAATLRAVAAQERYDAVLASGTASTRQLASAQAGLIAAQRGVTAAQKESVTSTEQTGRSMHGLLGTVRDLGLIFGGIEVAKKTIEFVGAGKELTTALNSVQAASQATDAQMGPVRAQVIGLGKDLRVPGATAVDAAHAIDDLVRSGMTLPRAMAAARSALLLASVTNTDMARSARVLGDALDEFRLPASEAAHVANMLAAASTSTAGGLETVFEALQYSGTRARAANVPMSDLLASIVDLSKAGLQGTTIGTGLAMAISKLASPSSAGAKALQDLGIEAFNAEGKFKGLPYIVSQVFEAQKRMGSGSQQFLHDVTQAFGARAANAIAGFAGKGIEGLDNFEHRLQNFDLQKAADNMNRGFSAAMRAVRKEATAAGIDLYQGLEPKVVSVAHWFGEELPRAGHAAAEVFGGPLHAAFVAVGAVVEAAGAVLKPVIDLLDSPVGSAVATGVLAMWAAFKGYQIAVAAGRAVREAMIAVEVRATNGLAAFRAYGAGVTGVLDGNASQAAATSAVMRAEFAQVEAAALEEAAGVDRAAAVQAEAYATLVAASDDASATMIANSQNTAAAAQAQAAASAEAAATAAAAADAAAADVDAAGEAAAVGWAGILGPVGIVAAGAVAAAAAFGLLGGSAKSNAADVDALTAAIQRDSGALGANTQQAVAHALASAGALDAASKLHLSLTDVTDAALHGGPALAGLNTALGLYMAGSYRAAGGTAAQAEAARTLYDALNDQNGSVQEAARHAREEAAATGQSTAATSASTAATQTATGAAADHTRVLGMTAAAYKTALAAAQANTAQTDAQTQAFQLENDAASLLQQALNGLAGTALNTASAQTSLASANLAVFDSFKTNGTAIRGNTKAAVANQQALQQQAQAAQGLAAAIGKRSHSTVAEAASMMKSRDALEAQLKAQGRLTPAVQAYVDRLYSVTALSDYLLAHPTKLDADPSKASAKVAVLKEDIRDIRQNRVPGLDADSSAARRKIRELQAAIDSLQGKTVTVTTVFDSTGKPFGGTNRAAGGPIVGPGTATSDSVPIMGSNGEHMISAREVQGLGGHSAVEAIRAAGRAGRRVAGFAAGGAITVGRTDGKKTWIYAGQQYASLRAAENAQHAAGSKTAKLEVEIRTKDLPGLMAALKATTSQLRAAEQTLSKAARDAGLTHKALARVADAEKRLNSLSRTRNRVAGELGAPTRDPQTAWQQLEAARTAYQGEHDTVASNITGGFDLAQAGRSSGTGVTVASILGDADQQRQNAALFDRQLHQLQAIGLGKAGLQQLAEKGFAGAESSALALLGASRTQIGQLNGSVAGLRAAAGQTGTFAADLLDGPAVRGAQGRVDRLQAQEARVDARMERLGTVIADTVRRGLGIPTPGGGAPHTSVKVYLGNREITDIIRTEVTQETRRTARAVHLQAGRP